MNFKKFPTLALGAIAGFSLLTVGFVSEAGAISYDLNCVTATTTCPSSITWGTIEFVQNGNNVDVTVDLIDDFKILQVGLNTSQTSGTYDTVGSNLGVIEAFNTGQVQGNGSYVGRFDLLIPDPPPGNVGLNVATFTISWSGGALNVNDLATQLDTANLLFAAVHIGNCGSITACPNDSIQVGTGVPEPASLMLLGAGLAGVGIWRRKSGKI